MASYFMEAINDRDDIVARIVSDLKDVDFQTIVVRGISGMYLAPIVAHLMGKELVAIRKPGEDSHDRYAAAVGRVIGKWIILDDFIQYGGTVKAIVEAVEKLPTEYGPVGKYRGNAYRECNSVCVGFYGYAQSLKDEAYTIDKIERWRRVLDTYKIDVLNLEARRVARRDEIAQVSA